MSSIQEEIKKHWDTQQRGYAREILSLIDTGFPAWTVILPDGRFGVAVPYSGNEPVFESFASAWIESLAMKNVACDECLVLCSFDSSFAFSSLCAEFVSPGESGKCRKNLASNPVAWWNEWKNLLGNKSVDFRVYDVLGELVSLLALSKRGENPVWRGPSKSTCDIDCDSDKYEVKSTLTRNSKVVQIHGLFQLADDGTRKHLLLARFEQSIHGISINSIVEDLHCEGFSKAELNNYLQDLGYPSGSSNRSKCYTLLDLSHYCVDESFPHISASSFVGGVLPQGVTSVNYCVSLDGIEGDSWLHLIDCCQEQVSK